MNGLVMNGPGKCWLQCIVAVGLEKCCFLWLCGVAIIAGLGKACVQ